MTLDAWCGGLVAIVDGYSSGRFLAPLFRERGVACVHVQTLPTPPFGATHASADFIADVVHDGGLTASAIDSLAARLRELGAAVALAGCESAVPLADLLMARLSGKAVDLQTALARRHKHVMQQTLARAGMPIAKCRQVRSREEAAVAADALGLPVVVKPVLGAGAQDVWFCSTLDEVARAADRALGKRNVLGVDNDALLVQELMVGTEYIANAVSRGGHHCVFEVWRCRKIRHACGKKLSGVEELLPISSSTEHSIVEFARKVLDALGVTDGPTHMELILTDEGPRLIELAARPQGGLDPDAVVSATGTSHVHLTVEACIRPSVFARRPPAPLPPSRRVYRVILRAPRGGSIVGVAGLERLRELQSYYSDSVKLGTGDALVETIDFVTTPGVVHLVSHDIAQLEADYEEIRRIEAGDGLFALA